MHRITSASLASLTMAASTALATEYTIPSAATPTFQFALEAPTSPVVNRDTSRFGTEMNPLDLDGGMHAVTDPSSRQIGIASLGLYVDHGAYELQIDTAPACAADFTDDGVLDVFDVFSFFDAFKIVCP